MQPLPPPNSLGTPGQFTLPALAPEPGSLKALMPGGLPISYGGSVPLFNIPGTANYVPPPPPAVSGGAAPPPGPPNNTPDVSQLMQEYQPPQQNEDFLTHVRMAAEGGIKSFFDALDAPAHYFARPAFEVLTEPNVLFQKETQADSLQKWFEIANESFDENQYPGLVKFLGETALNPLTYLSAGTLSAGANLVEKLPLAGEVLAGGLRASAVPVKAYEDTVTKGFQGLSSLTLGFFNNRIPLESAKNDAFTLLKRVIPEDLAARVINTVPNEYTGLDIGGITGPINKRFPNIGLPSQLAWPQWRALATQRAYNDTFQAMRTAYVAKSIDWQASTQEDAANVVRNLIFGDVSKMEPAEIRARDVILRPTVVNQTLLTNLAKKTGSTLDQFSLDKIYEANTLIRSYHMQQLPEKNAVDLLGSLVGSDITQDANRKALSDFIDSKSEEGFKFLNRITGTPGAGNGLYAAQVADAVAQKARVIANREFDLGIQLQRVNNTVFDQFLNGFENQYDRFWRRGIYQSLVQPTSTMFLEFSGFGPGFGAEALLRRLLGGGGVGLGIDRDTFAISHGFDKYAPSELFREEGGIASEVGKRADTGSPLNKIAYGPLFKWTVGLGDTILRAQKRAFWDTAWNQEFDNALFERGIGATTDTKPYFDALKPEFLKSFDPALADISDRTASDILKATTSSIARGSDNVEALKGLLDTNRFNKAQLHDMVSKLDWSSILPDQGAYGSSGLSPLSRNAWHDWVDNGEKTMSGLSQAIDNMVAGQRHDYQYAPEVIAEKFKGVNYAVDNWLQSGRFRSKTDILDALHEVTNVQNQLSMVPDLVRQIEAETIRSKLGTNSRLGSVRDTFNNRMDEALGASSAELDKSLSSLSSAATNFGIGPEVQQLGASYKAINQLLLDTWKADHDFQQSFWAANPSRKLQSTWDEFYSGRQNVWSNYATEHAKLVADTGNAWSALYNKFRGEAQTAASMDLNEAVDKMASGELNVTPQELYDAHNAEAKAGELNAAQEIQRRAAEEGGNIGEPNQSGSEGQQPAISPTGTNSGATSESIEGRSTSGVASNQQPPAAEPINSFLSYLQSPSYQQRYNNAANIRPAIEAAFQETVNNPTMDQTKIDAMHKYIDEVYKRWNSIDPKSLPGINEAIDQAGQRALARYNMSFINYDRQTAFDMLMKNVFPFWTYESRRWPWMAQNFIGKPSLAAAYASYLDISGQNGYAGIGNTGWQINPLRIKPFGGLQVTLGPDYPLRFTNGLPGMLDELEQSFGRFGFYLGPQFTIPAALITGQAGQALPELFRGAINLGRAAGMPGADQIDNLLPDPYKDYYTNMIIASGGQEPNKIRQAAANDSNSNEAQILDQAQRQSSLITTIMAQTGLLRYRTPEYTEWQNARTNALANITGISPEEQQTLRDNGISVSQITQLTPAQRRDLEGIPGTAAFNEISQSLLSPEAAALREKQTEFFDTLKTERNALQQEQILDDQRFQKGLIDGTEWRKRYQDRNTKISTLADDLKKSDTYKNVPLTQTEQATARARFNLPPPQQSPVDMVLQEYYAIKPEVDEVTGDTNFADFFDQRQAVLDKYPELKSQVEAELHKNDTPQVSDFRAAADLLRPYFGIKDQLLQRYPQIQQEITALKILQAQNPVAAAQARESDTTIKDFSKVVKEMQRSVREQFPQIDAALVKYYGATPIQIAMAKKEGLRV